MDFDAKDILKSSLWENALLESRCVWDPRTVGLTPFGPLTHIHSFITPNHMIRVALSHRLGGLGPTGRHDHGVKLVTRSLASAPTVHVDASSLTTHERVAMRHEIQTQGFAVSPRPILDSPTRQALHERYHALFQGDFETGVYPDEWHWVRGL